MLFNSYAFLIFFLLVVPAYYLIPSRYRYAWLLAASCYFYMALIPIYILFLFLLIAIDFTAGLWIERSEGVRRKHVLLVSLAANLSLLGTFKYFNFFGDLAAALSHMFGGSLTIPHLSLLLPLGLSFHTFQSMAYTIDVYKRRVPAERHLGFYALYVMFFPQLVAGPIERPQHLLPQLHDPKPFDPALATEGLRLILWGYFKKMVIADHLAHLVDPAYSAPAQASTGALAIATYLFAFQIYCDFSGYTDIARGTARILGVRLVENFQRPYEADSIVDFWHRWHISLSTWFRDYVYIPLGGSRGSGAQTIFNLLIVFLLSGLWHGANMTFVAWGLYHGVLVVIYRLSARWREAAAAWCRERRLAPVWKALSVLVTFHAVCLGWVFFRASTLSEALSIVKRLVLGLQSEIPVTPQLITFAGLSALFIFGEFLAAHARIKTTWQRWPAAARWGCYYALMILIAAYGNWGERQFIYFQF